MWCLLSCVAFSILARSMIPVFTRVLLPIWASALASGKKPFEVQRYVGTKKNAMKRLIQSALVIVGQKGSCSIVAIARVLACCRDVTTHMKDQLIASLDSDIFLQSNLAKYFQGDSFDVCFFDLVYDMRKFNLTWRDLESKTKCDFARNCGFCLANLSWEGHLFIQDLLERPAAIKYQFTWPCLSVKDAEDEISVSTPEPDDSLPDDSLPDVNLSDEGRLSTKRRRSCS